ncbi:tetratricopeptide repeat protein [bacterium]|nr:tetratricopeptide repeat protein [bacterium]
MPEDAGLAQEIQRARTEPTRALGPFLLLSELGKGGMGVVYRAWDDRLRRVVALKTISPDAAVGKDAIARFRREAEATARLRHPCIVAIHEAGELPRPPGEPVHYIAMDLVSGATLERRLSPGKGEAKLALVRALEVLRDVARAVHYAHGQGVIHRDLKPQNVIIDESDRPHVLDFGLARVRELGDLGKLTKTGAALGTPAYMPPEQAGGTGEADERSDVYSLGATLYFVLTGRPPFSGAASYNVLAAVLTKEPVPPSRWNARAAGDLETICLKCLEKDPKRRYESAEALALDLERHLRGDPIAARPIGSAERARRWVKRNRLLAAAGVLFLLLTAGFAVFLVQDRRARARAEREAAVREAESARRRFEETQKKGARAQLLADGLRAFETAMRAESLLRDEASRASAFEAASAFGDAALELGEWNLATAVFERARELKVDEARAVQKEHEKTIREILERARSGELEKHGGLEDALVTLASLNEDQTVKLLAAELESVRSKLPRLSPGDEVAAKLLCETLGRSERRKATLPLERYLEAEPDELRALVAGRALCRLGGPEAERAILAKVRSFGPGGPFWAGIAPFLPKNAAVTGEAPLGSLPEYWERAAFRKAKGDFQGALADLTKAIDLSPKDAVSWHNRGSVKHAMRDLDGALADLTRSIELAPRLGLAWSARGQVRYDRGDVDGAIEDYGHAIELDPAQPDVWSLRGNARHAKGDLLGAVSDCDRSIALDARFPRAWVNRGAAKRDLRDLEGAASDFQRAVELDPRASTPWNNLGIVRQEKGDIPGALEAFTHAIELDPKMATAWKNRADARYIKRDREGALADYGRAIELDPRDPYPYSKRGAVRAELGDEAGALADAEKFLELAPTDPEAAAARAWIEKIRRK